MDLRDLLNNWPYDENKNVRIIRGEDGREILQLRLPLGVEQYELEGRPDGQRFQGKESALDYYLAQFEIAEKTEGGRLFQLGADACADLFNEGTLYYYRYLHLFQIGEWRRAARDTARNLKVFDFVHQYGERIEDRFYLEKWRPYVLRINGIACAMLEIEKHNHLKALELLRSTLQIIESLPELTDEIFDFERKRSLQALGEIIANIEKTRPRSEIEQLETELRTVVEAEEFERAAELRDQIIELRKEKNVRIQNV